MPTATAQSFSNIALIKYWSDRDPYLRKRIVVTRSYRRRLSLLFCRALYSRSLPHHPPRAILQRLRQVAGPDLLAPR